MKAIVFTKYGSPEGLELLEVPKPTPEDHDLLVRVHASSVNSWDWEYLSGKPFINRLMYGVLRPKPGKQRLGADIAGTVVATGKAVSRFQTGDEVFGDLWDAWGGFAEFACAHEHAMERKPGNLSFEQAAAIPQAGVLALQGVRKATGLKPGHKVMINGAGGGVGTFAIQLAKLAGAEVTGVDAPHKLDVIRSLGADHVIDYTEQDFIKTGASYDLIVDCQGRRSMFAIRRVLKPGGVYALVGGPLWRIAQLWFVNLLCRFARDGRRLCLVAEGPNKGLAELAALVDSGKLVPAIDRTYRLDEVPEALRIFGQQRHKGSSAI